MADNDMARRPGLARDLWLPDEVADSQLGAAVLRRAGYPPGNPEKPSRLLNTCAIREHAEETRDWATGRPPRLKQARPKLKLGCSMYGSANRARIVEKAPWLDSRRDRCLSRLPEML